MRCLHGSPRRRSGIGSEDLRDVMDLRVPKRGMPVEVKDPHRAIRLRRSYIRTHWQHTPQRIRSDPGVRHRVARFGGVQRQQQMEAERENREAHGEQNEKQPIQR